MWLGFFILIFSLFLSQLVQYQVLKNHQNKVLPQHSSLRPDIWSVLSWERNYSAEFWSSQFRYPQFSVWGPARPCQASEQQFDHLNSVQFPGGEGRGYQRLPRVVRLPWWLYSRVGVTLHQSLTSSSSLFQVWAMWGLQEQVSALSSRVLAVWGPDPVYPQGLQLLSQTDWRVYIKLLWRSQPLQGRLRWTVQSVPSSKSVKVVL